MYSKVFFYRTKTFLFPLQLFHPDPFTFFRVKIMNQFMKNRLETIIRRDQISRLKFTNSFRKPVLSVKLSFRNGHEKNTTFDTGYHVRHSCLKIP